MSNELSLPGFTNRSLANAEDKIERFSSNRDVEDIYKEGVKHIAAEQIQAAKATAAVTLTTEVYDHALNTGDQFARKAYARIDEASHSEESQAASQALTNSLMARYNAHINGIVEVGVTGIARELHKEVILPKEEKRGWFR